MAQVGLDMGDTSNFMAICHGDIQWEHNGQIMRIWDNDIPGIWGSVSGHGELIRGNHNCQFVIWYVPDIAEDDDLSWNIRKKAHTHTYIYIYIYIYTLSSVYPTVDLQEACFRFWLWTPQANPSHYHITYPDIMECDHNIVWFDGGNHHEFYSWILWTCSIYPRIIDSMIFLLYIP